MAPAKVGLAIITFLSLTAFTLGLTSIWLPQPQQTVSQATLQAQATIAPGEEIVNISEMWHIGSASSCDRACNYLHGLDCLSMGTNSDGRSQVPDNLKYYTLRDGQCVEASFRPDHEFPYQGCDGLMENRGTYTCGSGQDLALDWAYCHCGVAPTPTNTTTPVPTNPPTATPTITCVDADADQEGIRVLIPSSCGYFSGGIGETIFDQCTGQYTIKEARCGIGSENNICVYGNEVDCRDHLNTAADCSSIPIYGEEMGFCHAVTNQRTEGVVGIFQHPDWSRQDRSVTCQETCNFLFGTTSQCLSIGTDGPNADSDGPANNHKYWIHTDPPNTLTCEEFYLGNSQLNECEMPMSKTPYADENDAELCADLPPQWAYCRCIRPEPTATPTSSPPTETIAPTATPTNTPIPTNTLTPTSTPSSELVVLEIRHEIDLSQYDYIHSDGNFNLSLAAALANSSGGVEITIDNQDNNYGTASFTQTTSPTYRFRFYLDPNGLTMEENSSIDLFNLYAIHAGLSRVTLGYSAGSHTITARTYNDNNQSIITSAHSISDEPHYIEVMVKYATSETANDGTLDIWIDGEHKQQIDQIDLFDITKPNNLWFGAFGVRTGIEGNFYLDELVLRNDATEIGPFGAPTATPTGTISPTATPTDDWVSATATCLDENQEYPFTHLKLDIGGHIATDTGSNGIWTVLDRREPGRFAEIIPLHYNEPGAEYPDLSFEHRINNLITSGTHFLEFGGVYNVTLRQGPRDTEYPQQLPLLTAASFQESCGQPTITPRPPTETPTTDCSDSDGGRNPQQPGICSDRAGDSIDQCVVDPKDEVVKLKEASCDLTENVCQYSELIDCADIGEGFVCLENMDSSPIAFCGPFEIPGDVQKDHDVDSDDAFLFCNHYNQTSWSNQLNPDPYGDGLVNLMDFGFIAKNWGYGVTQTDTPPTTKK
ncbi:hypothetical protein ACFLZP_02140 [Patescibacteria group bacterium]